MNTEASRMDRY